jgi:MFS family permease
MAACAGMAVASTISYSCSLFIEPLHQEFGWSRAQIMSGNSVAAILATICAPFTGLFVDRLGPRRIGLAAVITVCLAFTLLGQTGPSIWNWWALWLPLSLGIILVQPSVWTAAVTSLFSAGRGFALAVTLCGSSICSIFIPRLTERLITHFGWRMAWVGLGLFWLVIALPIVWLFFTSANDRYRTAKPKDDNSTVLVRPALRDSGILTRQYIQLLIAGMCISLVVVSMAISVVPVLSSNGISRVDAAWIAGLIGITSILGRLTIGMLLDRMDGRVIAAICVSLPVLGLLILIQLPGSIVAASVAVLIFGLSLGAELDIVAYLTSRYFGRKNFGFLFGTIGGFLGLASGNGSVLLNAVYDATGSYVPALWAAMPLCVVSALLFLFLGPYPKINR